MSTTPTQKTHNTTRVLFWGTYDLGKPRVRLLRAGLIKMGVDVLECHAPIWEGIEDKSQVKGVSKWFRIATSAILSYPSLVVRFMKMPRPDVVLVAYPGMLDLFVIKMFAWLRGVPVAWDWFLGAYDTIVLDRGLLPTRHPLSITVYALEWFAARLADTVFMDTNAHAQRMEAMFNLKSGRIGRVFVGAEEDNFIVLPTIPAGAAPQVLFYGQMIPLQGVCTIIHAARLLEDQAIDWVIVGQGQHSDLVEKMLLEHPLPRLRQVAWVEYKELSDLVEQSSVILGIFGKSDKADSVIPNKVFQALACPRPLVTRDSPAIREIAEPRDPAIGLVPPENHQALASEIQKMLIRFPPGSQCPVHPNQDKLGAVNVGTQLLHLLKKGKSNEY